ncbi:MAG TPA: DUF4328 domain-containing protein [Cyclobacteriaceae bacterium]|nr:DUF4328 domain-containing protein [Cyclobacteriaceae bacterium]
MESLRPNGQRAKNAVALIWIMLAMEIVSLISGYLQYDLLQHAANGSEIPIEAANANDTREGIVGVIYLIAYIVSAVTFIQWFRRAYFNLHLKLNYLSQTEGWAAGSWFVPVISLYRPYQIMRELYNETKELLTKNGVAIRQQFTTSTLGIWWTLWIISNIIGQFEFRYSLKAESLDELTTSTIIGMISNIIGIPLALIAIKVVRDYANVEPMLHELKEEEPTTQSII